jgi:pantothenate kinase
MGLERTQVVLTAEDALTRARALASSGRRVVLGLAGPPGGGKSTLAERIATDLGPSACVVVGMDGFHLAQEELGRLGRAERKGAPDTFDPAGYVALLRRLRDADEPVVYAPRFRRDIEEPVGSAVPVPAGVPLVVTEGNYLLLDLPAWRPVRELLDHVWFVDVEERARLERLVARHVAFGRTPQAARDRAYGSDQRNADLVATTRSRADAIVALDASTRRSATT